MENKDQNKKTKDSEKFPAYPHYSSSEDVYNQMKEEADLDPEDPTKIKSPNEDPDAPNEKDFSQSLTGDDLDVPNSDDELPSTEQGGIEDEENDYYSLGGDNHNNLEEEQGT